MTAAAALLDARHRRVEVVVVSRVPGRAQRFLGRTTRVHPALSGRLRVVAVIKTSLQQFAGGRAAAKRDIECARSQSDLELVAELVAALRAFDELAREAARELAHLEPAAAAEWEPPGLGEHLSPLGATAGAAVLASPLAPRAPGAAPAA